MVVPIWYVPSQSLVIHSKYFFLTKKQIRLWWQGWHIKVPRLTTTEDKISKDLKMPGTRKQDPRKKKNYTNSSGGQVLEENSWQRQNSVHPAGPPTIPPPTISSEPSGGEECNGSTLVVGAEPLSVRQVEEEEEGRMKNLQERFNFAEVWERSAFGTLPQNSSVSADFITVDIH